MTTTNTIRTRPAALNDAQAVAELFNQQWQTLPGYTSQKPMTVSAIHEMWGKPGFDLNADTRLAFDTSGTLRGAAVHANVRPPYVRHTALVAIRDHDAAGAALALRLYRWVIERSGKLLGRAPQGTRIVLTADASPQDTFTTSVLKQAGLTLARQFYRMVADLDAEPVVPPVPGGFTLRPMQPGEERLVLNAERESFTGHYSYELPEFETHFAQWQERYLKHATDLFYILWYGDQIAGIALITDTYEDDPTCGYIHKLGVMPGFRGRGIGKLLLMQGFHALWGRGRRQVRLHVDACNRSGAVGLYERAGMWVDVTYDHYDIELRPGEDTSFRLEPGDFEQK